jgi:alpha-glucosidase
MKKLVMLIMNVSFIFSAHAQKYELNSPDGKLKAQIEVEDGIHATLEKEGNTALKLGNLFLETSDPSLKSSDLKVKKVTRHSVNETIKPEIREKAEMIDNVYNEMEIRFRNNLSITFRLFDEGLAYRFSTSLKDSLTIYQENMNLFFDESDMVRFQSGYEAPYQYQNISGIKKGLWINLPILAEKQNGLFVLVTEADLYSYPCLWVKGTGRAQLTGFNHLYPKKLTYEDENVYLHGRVSERHDYIARVNGNRTYPWRIVAVASNEKELITNNMVYLLASPNALEDVSWITPGVVMFDWWAKYNIYGVDFKAGINTETAKYFIDFCAEHGFKYFLFDDGWCPKEDLLTVVPGLDMAEVTAYARTKGVDVMLWVIWHALHDQWDQAFDLFEKWGIKGIKMDFMNRDDQKMVEFYEAVAKKAAEKKMVVNFHGGYKPCGLRRKYPNVLTREALVEFEFNCMNNDDNPVQHNLLPYIRMVTGPMDYIPGTMNNASKYNYRNIGHYPMGPGTRAHSMALFVILNSPMTMLPDSPSDYYREKECTDFLAQIPVEWDETLLVEGKIAEYTVLARRSGSDWYVGAITNWDERTIEINTDFLAPGEYTLEAVEDGTNANTRAEDYKKTGRKLSAGEKLTLKLASGGGWVSRIVPLK